MGQSVVTAYGSPANGRIGALIDAHDWSASPLGPPSGWSPALATTLGIVLPAQSQIVLFWGPELVALYNDAYAPTIGDKHPRALGRPGIENWRELWDDLEPLLASVRRTGETVFAKDRSFYIERHGYGEEVFFDISYSAVRGERGDVEGILCIVNETTDAVIARRRLTAERQRLEELFVNAPGFMAILRGPDHVFELTNRAYQRLIGDRDVLGKPVADALPEVREQGFTVLLDKVYGTGETYTGKATRVELVQCPGGTPTTRYLDFVYQPMKDGDGRITGIFVEGQDVTERLAALQAQQESDERLRLATEAGGIGTWDFNPVSGELRWDDRCKALFGLSPSAHVTYEQSFVAALHPDDRERTVKAVSDALAAGGTGEYDIEYRAIGIEDGVERWIAARGNAVFVDGMAARFIGTVTDISDLKAAEDALSASEIALREESRALEILNRTMASVAAELDLDRLVQLVVDAGVELTRAAYGAFFYNVVDAAGESYMLYALAGAPREAFAGYPMPRNTAVFAPVFRGEGTVRSEDITKDPRYGHNKPHSGMPKGHLPVRSYLSVPVISRSGEVIGGLFFGHGTPGMFGERAERLVKGLASEAAIGIDNARLFRSSERLNQTLEAEVAVRTQERDRIWQVSQDLLGVADLEGRWTSVNPAWTRILGWSIEEIVGRTSEWLEHPDDRIRTRAEVTHLSTGGMTIDFENRFRTRGGDYRTFAWTGVAVEGLIYAVGRDVTEQRAQAAALAEAEERLRQSQKMETVGQLSGGIAHDFNNLLQIVSGNLETILRNLPAESTRLRRCADNAMTGAKRAAVLTQRLLAFSRRQPLDPKTVDINRLVPRMSELLVRTLGETIEVETVLGPGVWPVEVDPHQLEAAILNLAINARDAMPAGGKLTIETANTHFDHEYVAKHPELAVGQYAMLSVPDTGIGMDGETLARAFEPFFTTKEPGKGTGLGLSMVYGFVKQSGGHVKIYSEPARGTTVKIYVPRLMSPSATEDADPPPGVVPHGSNAETILICEDDEGVRAYSAEVLRELGYRVIEVQDGPSALRYLADASLSVDLLFTDVVLPGGMTGAVLAENARRLKPKLRVLFTTGYARNAIVHHGRLDAGVELITKPFTYADLAARVRDVLDR